MKVSERTVVTFEYTLKNAEGELLDTSDGHAPLAYLHGSGQIVPGLEKELDGREAGDELAVELSPDVGYGAYDDAKTFQASKADMGLDVAPEVGMSLMVDAGQGQFPVHVKAVEGEQVTLDANHPLAGVDLHFQVKIVEVRPATDEEVEHGHAHGEGGEHDH